MYRCRRVLATKTNIVIVRLGTEHKLKYCHKVVLFFVGVQPQQWMRHCPVQHCHWRTCGASCLTPSSFSHVVMNTKLWTRHLQRHPNVLAWAEGWNYILLVATRHVPSSYIIRLCYEAWTHGCSHCRRESATSSLGWWLDSCRRSEWLSD